MTEILTCPVKVPIGTIILMVDKATGDSCKAKILREASEEEYLNDPGLENPSPAGYYYEVSFD